MDEESIAAPFLQDGGQNLGDELRERDLGDLVLALRLVNHVGVEHPPVWGNTHVPWMTFLISR